MLTSQIIQRVREIQIRTGRQAADVLAGQYVSVFKGQGVEFEEVRPYIPGDDVRTIDWNVTARTGAPYVKRYVEERQLTIMLVVDVSASQDFGSGRRSKREAAAELSALLAFSAIANDDKVGLVLFHGGIEQYIPPRKGQKHAMRVIREVLAHGEDGETNGARSHGDGRGPVRFLRDLASRRRAPRSGRQATDIAGAMDFLMSVNRRHAVCFVVSDFLDEGYERAMRMANRRHDVVGVRVFDPRERDLVDAGLIHVRDPETGRTMLLDPASKAVRHAVAEESRRVAERQTSRLRKSGMDVISIDASGSVVDPLVKFFRQREKRRARV
jgi:uncharacterized protein (DUF58 family)